MELPETKSINTKWDRDNGQQFVYLPDLKQRSLLHLAVVGGAPLDMVQLVYNKDPSAMNKAIFYDACCHSGNVDVIEFLKTKLSEDEVQTEVWEVLNDYFNQVNAEIPKKEFFAFSLVFPETIMEYMPDDNAPFFKAVENNILDDEEILAIIQKIPTNETHLHLPWWAGMQSRVAWATFLSGHQLVKSLTTPVYAILEIDQDLLDTVCGLVSSPNSRLKTLVIKDKQDVERTDTLLFPLLDALATSTTVKYLEVDVKMNKETLESYKKKMIEILQQNTTLVEFDMGPKYDPSNEEEDDLIRVIQFYLYMNKRGRAAVKDRDPNTVSYDRLVASLVKGYQYKNGEDGEDGEDSEDSNRGG